LAGSCEKNGEVLRETHKKQGCGFMREKMFMYYFVVADYATQRSIITRPLMLGKDKNNNNNIYDSRIVKIVVFLLSPLFTM
jgi:hypothetical protein